MEVNGVPSSSFSRKYIMVEKKTTPVSRTIVIIWK